MQKSLWKRANKPVEKSEKKAGGAVDIPITFGESKRE